MRAAEDRPGEGSGTTAGDRGERETAEGEGERGKVMFVVTLAQVAMAFIIQQMAVKT